MRRPGIWPTSTTTLCGLTLCLLLSQSTFPGEQAVSPESDHWAYQPPRHARSPSVRGQEWCRNVIDRFVLSRIEREGLPPSAEADQARLLRRVSLDLIGLPPTVAELDEFLGDDSPVAYERAVDRLLASPAYGERWATPWLDAARYADSNGFQRDGHRVVWPFRDWVIRALNDDMPFDQFTIEQLAGDLLPNATLDQNIATGFHRGTTVNVEAGTDQEENRVNQIFDRVNVTGTVWLGTTLECCQCHDHKFDPFSQQEYYRLFAFFNNTEIETREQTKGSAARDFIGPSVSLPDTPELTARRQSVAERMQSLNTACEQRQQSQADHFAAWLQEASAAVAAGNEPKDIPAGMMRLLKLPTEKRNKKQQEQLQDFFFSRDDELKAMRQEVTQLKQQLDKLQPATSLAMVELSQPRVTRLLKRGNFETPGEEVSAGTPRELPAWSDDLPRDRLGFAKWLVRRDNPLTARVIVNRHWAEFFGRGLHATPEDFGVMSEEPLHRELLDWLAAELMVGGMGGGEVGSDENSPQRLISPSHNRHHWDIKRLHRLIVTSATYRQASRATAALRANDPENKLLARGPRPRLTAEMIRDQALAVSGLLARKLGGPPVYPPQPANLWRVTGAVDNTYRTSTGADRYRRGVYTVWRRSSPYPSFVNFDAPDRAACVVNRPRTNTPLQALTLLNDPVYVEAAAALAEQFRSSDVAAGIESGFRLCLSRSPSADELRTLVQLFEAEKTRLEANPSDAQRLLRDSATNGSRQEEANRAAWISVANALLNLDELITKG